LKQLQHFLSLSAPEFSPPMPSTLCGREKVNLFGPKRGHREQQELSGLIQVRRASPFERTRPGS
jgi:hypothetical protein